MTIFFLALFLLLLPFLTTALMSNILYWYEALNNPCPQLPPPPPTPLRCAFLYMHTVLGYLVGIIVHPLGWGMKLTHSKQPADPAKPPLLFIHGIYDNPSTWTYLRPKLEQHGYRTTNFAYHSFFIPLDDIVKNFDAAICEMETRHPGHKPVLVAHSLGGIIARLWLLDPHNEDRIKGLITVATPHSGSRLAAMAPGKLIKQIAPHADVIAQLHKESTPPRVPCVSLCSNTDEAVLPAASLLPPEGWKLRPMEQTSHVGILFRKATAKALLEELSGIYRAAS